jgi:hypothetical protein
LRWAAISASFLFADRVEQEIHKQGEGEAMVGEALLSDMELGMKAGTVVLPHMSLTLAPG